MRTHRKTKKYQYERQSSFILTIRNIQNNNPNNTKDLQYILH